MAPAARWPLYLASCVLLLLQACLPAAEAQYDPNFNSAFSATTASSFTNLASQFGGASITMTCAHTSVASYGPNSIAVAFSTGQAQTTVNTANAASAVSKVLSDAVARGDCLTVEDTSTVYAAATACARAMIKGRTSSLSYAFTQGGAVASASGCAFSAAYAQSLANALAYSISSAMSGGDSSTCEVFASVEGKAYVEVVAKALVSGMARSWTGAYASNYPRSSPRTISAPLSPSVSTATASAMYYSDVSAYSRAIARLFSFACARCSGGINRCKLCSSKTIPHTDSTAVDTFSEAANARTALAVAISEAGSKLCGGVITRDTAMNAVVSAVSDICVQLTVSACGWTKASGSNAIACSSSFSTASLYGVSETLASVVGSAFSLATEKDACAGTNIASLMNAAQAMSQVNVAAVAEACQFECSKSQNGMISYKAAGRAVFDIVKQAFSSSSADAFAIMATQCSCEGNCWCGCHGDSRKCAF